MAAMEMVGVPVVGSGDDHGVDVFAREHLAIVARGEDLVAVDLAGARQPAVVDIADGREFDAGNGDGVLVSPIPMPPNPIVAMRMRLLGETSWATATEAARRRRFGETAFW